MSEEELSRLRESAGQADDADVAVEELRSQTKAQEARVAELSEEQLRKEQEAGAMV